MRSRPLSSGCACASGGEAGRARIPALDASGRDISGWAGALIAQAAGAYRRAVRAVIMPSARACTHEGRAYTGHHRTPLETLRRIVDLVFRPRGNRKAIAKEKTTIDATAARLYPAACRAWHLS